jgi:hypothetical protein
LTRKRHTTAAGPGSPAGIVPPVMTR